tara:strand:+ start:1080 stop:1448 length:369 start_codon:yes stop_codon:yes gene_type:complete
MSVGKCVRKNWAWKPVNANLIDFEDTDTIGTIRCVIESKSSNLFSEKELKQASEIAGYVKSDSSPLRLVYCIPGQDKPKDNLESFKALKSQIARANLVSADRAIISSKKAIRQINTIRCGSK